VWQAMRVVGYNVGGGGVGAVRRELGCVGGVDFLGLPLSRSE